MKDIKITKGRIDDKTLDSIKVNNLWIKFFDKEKLESLKVGNKVNVIYYDNIKNNKTYHNGKEIELELIKETQPRTSMSDSTLNTMIMTVKEVYLNNGIELSYPEVTQLVIESYKLLRNLD